MPYQFQHIADWYYHRYLHYCDVSDGYMAQIAARRGVK